MSCSKELKIEFPSTKLYIHDQNYFVKLNFTKYRVTHNKTVKFNLKLFKDSLTHWLPDGSQ